MLWIQPHPIHLVEQDVVVEPASGAAPLRLNVRQQPECLPVFGPDLYELAVVVFAPQAGIGEILIARSWREQRAGGAL